MPFFFWHQTNILLCNFTSRSIPLALMLITKSSAIAKLSFAATKSCPVLIMMLASSLTILGMHLQSEAQHCSFYTLFSNVGTVLVIAVCCKISSSLCHSWWTLTLKQEGGQTLFADFSFCSISGSSPNPGSLWTHWFLPSRNSEYSSEVYHGKPCACVVIEP